MVRCVDCRKLEIHNDKFYLMGKDKEGKKVFREFNVIVPAGKPSPIGELKYLRCKTRGLLRHNWNIYKERKCEYFESGEGS